MPEAHFREEEGVIVRAPISRESVHALPPEPKIQSDQAHRLAHEDEHDELVLIPRHPAHPQLSDEEVDDWSDFHGVDDSLTNLLPESRAHRKDEDDSSCVESVIAVAQSRLHMGYLHCQHLEIDGDANTQTVQIGISYYWAWRRCLRGEDGTKLLARRCGQVDRRGESFHYEYRFRRCFERKM